MGLNIAAAAAEFGVLPSVFIWGSEALEHREAYHVAFDFAAWRRYADAKAAAMEKAQHGGSAKAMSNAIKSGKKGKVMTGGNLPDL